MKNMKRKKMELVLMNIIIKDIRKIIRCQRKKMNNMRMKIMSMNKKSNMRMKVMKMVEIIIERIIEKILKKWKKMKIMNKISKD